MQLGYFFPPGVWPLQPGISGGEGGSFGGSGASGHRRDIEKALCMSHTPVISESLYWPCLEGGGREESRHKLAIRVSSDGDSSLPKRASV